MIKVLKDRIVVEIEEAKETIKNGIYLPASTQEKQQIGKVVAVGKEVDEVQVGNEILYSKYAGTEVKVDGKDYLIIREADVFAIL